MLNQKKWKKKKTPTKKGTTAPYFNEAFTFLVPFSQVQVGCWEEGQGEARPCALPKLTSSSCPLHWPVPVQSVDLVLAVWARGLQLQAKPVGKVLLGPRASGQPLQHWADMLAHARRPIAQWHRLQPAKEVDRVLALQPRLRLPVPHP